MNDTNRIPVTRGSDLNFRIDWKEGNGDPFDLTGWTVSPFEAHPQLDLTLTVPDPASGQVEVRVEWDDAYQNGMLMGFQVLAQMGADDRTTPRYMLDISPDYQMDEHTVLTAIMGPQGPEGPQGPQGPQGPEGPASTVPGPKGEQGPKGDDGEKGEKGDPPAHEWDDTALRFEEPGGGWGAYVDLKGPQGEKGIQGIQGEQGEEGPPGEQGEKGEKGDPPAHEWSGTELRFEEPDGSWGAYVDLKGPQGEQGEQGEKGEKGEKGETGPPMAVVVVDDESEIPDPPVAGTVYFVRA